ncbi:MAG: pyrroloquinoline quinone-dependent dehydrogenase [Hyphomicrobium sp.]
MLSLSLTTTRLAHWRDCLLRGLRDGAVAALLLSSPAMAADITDEAMKNAGADSANWLLHGRDYANQRFSPLADVNTTTVKKLVPKWIYQTGIAGTFQTTPIVVDGMMYVSTPFSNVIAVDARTGREKWRYEHKRTSDKLCCGPANRGVSLGYGKIYIATVDAHLIALDQATGKKLWDITLVEPAAKTEDKASLSAADPRAKDAVSGSTGVGTVAAPLVYQGKVIIGITGVGYGLHFEDAVKKGQLTAVVGIAGRYGQPGFMAAFDAETGAEKWRFETTKKGWEGAFLEKTAYGVPLNRNIEKEKSDAPQFTDAWSFGGGSVWHSPAVDTERGLIYFGTGNPSPQSMGDGRPGDNLYTVSLVALEAATGKLVWHYQQVPHDRWGYDVASPPTLFDAEIDGKKIPAVGQASKIGWYFVHDRTDGKLLYTSDAFVPQENIFAPPSKEGVRVAPGAGGGANWSPTSYDAEKGVVYIAALHMPFTYRIETTPGSGDNPPVTYSAFEPSKEPHWGLLTALDLKAKGKILWQQKTDEILIGGVLATKGGLVFSGEGNGDFSAFDSATGKRLWSFNCGAGVNAPPISYAIDGKQYIAVAAGGSSIWGFRTGDAVMVFGLSD